jgi:uncharacterized glyoxalase superfamily protein PhnB
MEPRKTTAIPPGIRVKNIEKSLDFYTKTLGFQASEKVTSKEGKIAHAIVGLDANMLMLAPVENTRAAQPHEDLSKDKLGIGVEFSFGMNGSKKLDQFFTEVKAKGVTVVHEPKTEFWGDRIFTVTDPDGYVLTFTEHANDVAPDALNTAYESAHKK